MTEIRINESGEAWMLLTKHSSKINDLRVALAETRKEELKLQLRLWVDLFKQPTVLDEVEASLKTTQTKTFALERQLAVAEKEMDDDLDALVEKHRALTSSAEPRTEEPPGDPRRGEE